MAATGSVSRQGSIAERLAVAPEIAEAIRAGRPVVALESTLISHGLPWPRNLEVAVAAETAVRSRGQGILIPSTPPAASRISRPMALPTGRSSTSPIGTAP